MVKVTNNATQKIHAATRDVEMRIWTALRAAGQNGRNYIEQGYTRKGKSVGKSGHIAPLNQATLRIKRRTDGAIGGGKFSGKGKVFYTANSAARTVTIQPANDRIAAVYEKLEHGFGLSAASKQAAIRALSYRDRKLYSGITDKATRAHLHRVLCAHTATPSPYAITNAPARPVWANVRETLRGEVLHMIAKAKEGKIK